MRTSVLGALLATLAAGTARADPYPSSPLLPGLALDWSSYTRLAVGADNWATTWSGDGKLYASFGDGVGLTAGPRQSLGFARLTGSSAQAVDGVDLPTGALRSGKSYGVLAIGRTLYTFVSPGSGAANYREARLYRAPLGTDAWQGADWAFTSGGPEHIILPAFIQAGPGYAGGGPYVYAYAPRYAPRGRGLSIQAGTGANGITLMRAPKGDLMDRESWQYFAGLAGGRPRWSDDPAALRPAIQDRAGVGWTVSAIYDRALHRYLIMTEHGRSFASRLTLLEAPRPWGPFRTVAYTTVKDPQGRVQPRAFYFNILPNSFSRDGKRFTLAFTGVGDGDALNLVDGSFAPGGKGPVTAATSRVRTRTVPTPAAARRSALKAAARRGAAAFASGLASARSQTAPIAGGAALGLDAAPEGRAPGLAVFPVGQAASTDLSPSPDPSRAGFEQAYAPEGDDSGVGLEYGLPGGTRLGLVLTTRDDAAGGGAGLASQAAMAAYLRQRLGVLQLDTSFAYSKDGHVPAGYNGSGWDSFAGRTTSVAERVGLPLRASGGLTLTPWVGLAYMRQAADGFALEDPLLGEQRYDGVEVGDTLASLGLDGELAPVRLGERAWLTLHGGVSYTQGLVQDDYRVQVAALGTEHTETVARPATQAIGLSLDGSLALGDALAVQGGMSVAEDLAAGPAGVGQVRLSWRF